MHVVLHRVIGQAVRDGLLLRNPADTATPPSAREAKAPEMHPWDAGRGPPERHVSRAHFGTRALATLEDQLAAMAEPGGRRPTSPAPTRACGGTRS
jgi:hypothetical protein